MTLTESPLNWCVALHRFRKHTIKAVLQSYFFLIKKERGAQAHNTLSLPGLQVLFQECFQAEHPHFCLQGCCPARHDHPACCCSCQMKDMQWITDIKIFFKLLFIFFLTFHCMLHCFGPVHLVLLVLQTCCWTEPWHLKKGVKPHQVPEQSINYFGLSQHQFFLTLCKQWWALNSCPCHLPAPRHLRLQRKMPTATTSNTTKPTTSPVTTPDVVEAVGNESITQYLISFSVKFNCIYALQTTVIWSELEGMELNVMEERLTL